MNRQTFERLALGVRSIRFRIAFMFAIVLLGLGALTLAAVNVSLERSLKESFVATQTEAEGVTTDADGSPRPLASGEAKQLKTFEQKVNSHAIKLLGQYSLTVLGLLALVSFLVAWLLAGRTLRPIGAIAAVAREIEATDLSRRIALTGPRDELRALAEAFDALLARLEAAFASERRFIADASHELRNPLAIIRANLAELEGRDGRDADLAEEIAALRRATDRMVRLVDDLVLVARAQSPASETEAVDLERMLDELADDYRAIASPRSVSIDVAVAPGLTLEADGQALIRAVANLLDNALRYSPDGSDVVLRAGRESGWIWIAVRDRGPGVAPDDEDLVFTRRWRRADHSHGVGLGLAIVRQIAEAHGGTARVDAAEDGGAIFTMWLRDASDGPPPASLPRLATS